MWVMGIVSRLSPLLFFLADVFPLLHPFFIIYGGKNSHTGFSLWIDCCVFLFCFELEEVGRLSLQRHRYSQKSRNWLGKRRLSHVSCRLWAYFLQGVSKSWKESISFSPGVHTWTLPTVSLPVLVICMNKVRSSEHGSIQSQPFSFPDTSIYWHFCFVSLFWVEWLSFSSLNPNPRNHKYNLVPFHLTDSWIYDYMYCLGSVSFPPR